MLCVCVPLIFVVDFFCFLNSFTIMCQSVGSQYSVFIINIPVKLLVKQSCHSCGQEVYSKSIIPSLCVGDFF